MDAMDPALTAARWDAEYREGRYLQEPPIPFVEQILTVLLDHRVMLPGIGLYIGCGNGRNYLPLVEAGPVCMAWTCLSRHCANSARAGPPRRRPSSVLISGGFIAPVVSITSSLCRFSSTALRPTWQLISPTCEICSGQEGCSS